MAKKVVVAMSGGVDSSVAAALLKEQGYDVYGITMRLSNWAETPGRTFGGCCGSKDFYDARAVAQALDIPHYVFDYVEEFRASVIGYFKDSYLSGETPNPCIACNQHIKFSRLLDQAVAMGADFLATGHYARIEHCPESRVSSPGSRTQDAGRGTRDLILKRAIDPAKDQSYVLYGLQQRDLARILFPLGGYAKTQIRALARKYGLKTADKPDSQEICFVPNLDYKQFIREEVAAAQFPAGPIVHKDGRVLGQHQGLPFYTIGQREGLGLAVGHPLYVLRLEPESNTLVVGEKDDVFSEAMLVREVSWVGGAPPPVPIEVTVKIRYRHQEARAMITADAETRGLGDTEISASPRPCVVVRFAEPQSAVTPGQAAVFYQGDTVLGGGVIDKVAVNHLPLPRNAGEGEG